jgi:hypothetical protein
MVDTLDEDDYDTWLSCPVDRMITFMRQFAPGRLKPSSSHRTGAARRRRRRAPDNAT